MKTTLKNHRAIITNENAIINAKLAKMLIFREELPLIDLMRLIFVVNAALL